MSLFERLLNLDSELIVLGTKAFIAKEEMKSALKELKEDYCVSSAEFEDDVEEDEVGEYEGYFERQRKKAEIIFEENRIRNEKEAAERAQRIVDNVELVDSAE